MSKLEEMWVELAKYQDKANERGHGVSWAEMCKLKTERAAWAAARAAKVGLTNDTGWAAAHAAYAASDASYAAAANDAFYAASWAQKAIKRINEALGETE